jgi:hypothetical protein
MSSAREAVADARRRVKSPAASRHAEHCQCGGRCARCRAEARLASRDRQEPTPVSAVVSGVLRSTGEPIQPQLRATMEEAFGQDFSRVRVHTDARAAESARALDASAYTLGSQVVFAAGRYETTTAGGRRLLAHELAHVVQQADGPAAARGVGPIASRQERDAETAAQRVTAGARAGMQTTTDPGVIQRQPAAGAPPAAAPPAAAATGEDVWGLRVAPSMCPCRVAVRASIDWANVAGGTYASCDKPANAHGTDVEACFTAAHPTSIVAATTSASGTVTLPTPSADPCERIDQKASFVHETMHARHVESMARAQGTAFFREWVALRTDPHRLETLRPRFPAQAAAIDRQFNDGHDWAQDEVNSYRWERRFLQDCLAALGRVCR